MGKNDYNERAMNGERPQDDVLHPELWETMDAERVQQERAEREQRKAAQRKPTARPELEPLPAATTPTTPRLRSVTMSEVQPEGVSWLWDRRIPLGMLSLIEGEPDVGKSTVALDIMARVTTGRPMPLEEVNTEPANVILWAPEDPAAQVIRPRLDAAEANCARVRLITDPLTLPDDVDALAQLIEADKAKLLIIEPLTGALGGKVDSYKDHDVRRALMPLVELAARTGAAIVAIRHLRKGDGPAIHRGGGSIAIAALARSVLAVGKDPADDKARVIARTKGNLSMLPPALRYTFVPVGHVARVEWLGECNISADDLLAQAKKKPSTALQKAMDVLRAILAGGELPQKEVEEQAQAVGVASRTLRRAYEALQCPKPRKEPGKDGRWFWRLPVGAKVDDVVQPVSPEE